MGRESLTVSQTVFKFRSPFFSSFLLLFRAAPPLCGGSPARGPIGATAAGLHHSSRQRRIPDPRSEARDRTRNRMVPSQIRFHCATTGTPSHRLVFTKVYKLVPYCFLFRVTKQRGSAGRLALTLNHTSRKGLSLAAGQSSAGAVQGEACLRPPVLDESLIREQTKVDHFWGELPALSLRLFWEEGRCWPVVPLPLAGWEQAQEGSRFPLDSRGTASTC